jgi:hypothetical protein
MSFFPDILFVGYDIFVLAARKVLMQESCLEMGAFKRGRLYAWRYVLSGTFHLSTTFLRGLLI